MTSKPLDYSKWDSLEVSSDDEDAVARPTVHTLSGGKVRIGNGTVEDLGFDEKEDSAPQEIKDAEVKIPNKRKRTDDLDYNGAHESADGYYWSQSRTEVTIHVEVPAGTRAKALKVEGLEQKRLKLSVNGKCTFDMSLKYDFIDDEDALEGCWELRDHPATASSSSSSPRLVKLTLKKKAPQGTVIWWSSVFEGGKEIDVSSISERKAASQSMADAWNEAHRIFRERAQQGKIDLDDLQ